MGVESFWAHFCVCCEAGDTGNLGGAMKNKHHIHNNFSKYQRHWMLDVERWEHHSGTNKVGKRLFFFLQIFLYLFCTVFLHRFIILLGISVHTPGLSKGIVSCVLFLRERKLQLTISITEITVMAQCPWKNFYFLPVKSGWTYAGVGFFSQENVNILLTVPILYFTSEYFLRLLPAFPLFHYFFSQ